MDLKTAIDGLKDAKSKLQTRQAVSSLPLMSEQMHRLAIYTNAVEDHLAQLEKDLEIDEAAEYRNAVKDGKSPSAAEKVAKYANAETKAEIKYLSRVVKSAWSLIGIQQSRWNHLEKEAKGQV